MSIKTIQKRIKQVMIGTMMSGAMVFTPMSGCDLVASGNPAVKGLLDAARTADSSLHPEDIRYPYQWGTSSSEDAPSTSEYPYLEIKLSNVQVVSYN